jgi:hypothetical protein
MKCKTCGKEIDENDYWSIIHETKDEIIREDYCSLSCLKFYNKGED